MTLRFNTLYRGSAADAADELDGGDHTIDATTHELQVALVNALRRIAALEAAEPDARLYDEGYRDGVRGSQNSNARSQNENVDAALERDRNDDLRWPRATL